jgi:hypothetical protein
MFMVKISSGVGLFLVLLQKPVAISFGSIVLPLSVFRMLFKLLLTVNSIPDLDL